MSRLQDVILRDDRASQPAATAVATGSLYYVTDEFLLERSNGTTWDNVGGAVASLAAVATVAVALQTPRNINGVAFDGTANITVTAAASTLTGTLGDGTLSANVPLLNAANLFTTVQSVERAGIAAVSTDGALLHNTTASTAIATIQQSPRLRFRSQVWNTTAVAANNTDDFWIESVPVSGLVPSGLLKIGKSLNGGATTFPLTLTSGGVLTVNGIVCATSNVQIPASSHFLWANGTSITSIANAQINFLNNGGTAGAGIDVATDTIFKIRTRAQTGYATVDALGYRVSGAAGVSFGPAAVASITVVNGIVTAIS